MINTALLKESIDESGLSQIYIAKKLNISRNSLWHKINNRTEFLCSEIDLICKLLNLSNKVRDAIFFS